MKKTLLALALIGASTSAFADSWVYGGASGGTADINGESGTAYNVHVGTGLLPLIGVEAGYNKFEDFSNSGGLTIDDTYVAVKPSINFGPLQVYGKAGLHKWDSSYSHDNGDDGYDTMYGVGADYEVFGPISVGANFMNYMVDGDNVETYSLTVSINLL
ncbi:outer membrane beta-barrel protein [Vibrio sp. CAIM 722]|uniref:Outer membrane beta-barrel protein n=1 Tax=Vibrio eleionomae TaxID=2653505 RepID=A0A7X4RWJ0_9VIBR|nr:outer membrane beta-barrel protein [Vibrio eleionomae]MZI95425.1 outer membrane beta-barrel protein [Vibrio eleionomae]